MNELVASFLSEILELIELAHCSMKLPQAMQTTLEVTASRYSTRAHLALLATALLLILSAGCTNRTAPADDAVPPLTAGAGDAWWDRQEQTVRVPSDDSLPQASDLLPKSKSFLPERLTLPHNPAPPSVPWRIWQFFDLTFFVVLGGIIGAAIVIVVLILVIRRPDFHLSRLQNQKTTRLQIESAKVSELPFELEVSDEGFLATAKRYASEGDYNKAIIYLFSYVLVELDHRRLLTLRRGKTNRMLLNELRSHSKIASHFRTLMLTFERVFFGRHQIGADDYESCLRSCESIANSDADTMKVDNKIRPALGTAVLLLCITLVSGCDQLPREEYGHAGDTAPNSLAGFSAFREMFDSEDRRSAEIQRLSPRLNRFGTIVWTPESYAVPSPRQCAWINDWLMNNPGATFIYVGRDYMPGEDYWKEVAAKAPLDNQLDYIVQAAHSASNDDEEFTDSSPRADAFSRWFVLRPAGGRPTSSPVHGIADGDEFACVLKTRNVLAPVTDLDSDELQTKYAAQMRENVNADIDAIVEKLEQSGGSAKPDNRTVRSRSNGSSDDSYTKSINKLAAEKYQAKLERERIAKTPGLPPPAPQAPIEDSVLDQIATDSLSDIQVNTLFATQDSVPLIYEVSNTNWPDSKLIVINNGSLCCNYALADEDRRRVAISVIQRTRDRGRVGFLTLETPSLQYSNPESNDAYGLALFTIYPLNIILAHCLMLGFGALIAMWPIFGRPQGLTLRGASDFGKHIEAFGQLLRKTKDRAFALRLIGRYHREIRKDTSSVWSNVDGHAQSGMESQADTNSNPPSPYLQ